MTTGNFWLISFVLALGIWSSAMREAHTQDEAVAGTAAAEEGRRLQQEALALYEGRDLEAALETMERAVAVLGRALGAGHPDVAAAHDAAGALYFGGRRIKEAEGHYRRAIELFRSSGAREHRGAYANVLHNLAILLGTQGRLSEADPLALEAFEVLETASGDNKAKRANVLTTLAGIRNGQEKPEDAEHLYRKALYLWRQVPGEGRNDLITGLEKLAEFYNRQEKRDAAEKLYREALEIRTDELGPDSLAAGEGLGHLGRVLMAQGKYNEAARYLERSVALVRQHLGAEHPHLGTALNNLAILYRRMSDYNRAERAYKEALEVYKADYGSPDYVNALGNLARLYEDTDRLTQAEAAYREVLAILSQAVSPEHDLYFDTQNKLARFYERTERYSEAARILEELLRISKRREHAGPREGLDIAARLHGIREKLDQPGVEEFDASVAMIQESRQLNKEALERHAKAEYDAALELLEQSLELAQAALGTEHKWLVGVLQNVAVLAHEIADYPKAERFYRRALEVAEKTLPPDSPELGHLLNNLGEFHRAKGGLAQAREFYERALEVRARKPGPESDEYAVTLNSLASLYKDLSQHRKAEPLYLEALAIFERLGNERAIGMVTANLGFLAFLRSDYDQAETYLARARALTEKTLGTEHLDYAILLENEAAVKYRLGNRHGGQALFQRALDLEGAVLGGTHPRVARSLHRFGIFEAEAGNSADAVGMLQRSSDIEERHLAQLLLGGTESERRAVMNHITPETHEIVSLHVQAASGNPDALKLALDTVLRRKGRVLDAMMDSVGRLRAHATPEVAALFGSLLEVSSRLAALDERGPGAMPVDKYRELIQELEQERRRLESSVSARSAEYRAGFAQVSIEAVRAVLPERAVLVEMFRYRPYPRWNGGEVAPNGAERYVAYMLRDSGEAAWVDLGKAALVDDAVGAWREALADPSRADTRSLARELDDRIMRPVRALIGDARLVLLAPDGALNLVPFGALVDEEGRYLVERYIFAYLNSGRDLLRLKERTASRSGPVVIANPNYMLRGRAKARTVWNLLPRTLEEAEAVEDAFPGARVLSWDQATEGALRELRGPRVLHVASHGFFEAQLRDGQVSDNPLLRSGLVLAGANGPPAHDDDGIVSALELSGLDLWGTRLVVLSACETGLGEVQQGEGVYGLRRALVLAGAESQVISLWQVSSAGTRDFMRDYYRRLQEGAGRAEALRAVQRAMLGSKKYSHPYYWAAFIPSGQWAPLGD